MFKEVSVNYNGPVLVKNMQIPPSFRSGHIGVLVQKNAQCSETNEKSIFRFLRYLVFEIWSLNLNHLAEFFFVPNDAHCSEMDFLVHEFFLVAIFNFCDEVDFVLNIRSELGTCIVLRT